MNEPKQSISVEVAYARPDVQHVIACRLPLGSDVKAAILASKLLNDYPELELEKLQLGIFSRACQLDEILKSGDRVEIYRPLTIDPKQRRKLLAAKSQR